MSKQTSKQSSKSDPNEWSDAKLKLFAFCLFYCMESTVPFFTSAWPKWKRKLVFNWFVERLVSRLVDKLCK